MSLKLQLSQPVDSLADYSNYFLDSSADQALTTLAMRKFCEDKVSSSLQPSQNRCGPSPRHGVLTIIGSSIHSSTSPPQVHLLLQWPAVQHHQDEQQPFVPPPDPHSIAPKLPNRGRYVFPADSQLHSSPVGVIVECCVPVSCRFLPLPKDLPVSAAGLHLCCLVSTQQVVRLRCVRWTDVVYTRLAHVFRCRQVCFTQLRHVWTVLCVCLELVWPYFFAPSFFSLCASVCPVIHRAPGQGNCA